MRRALAMWEVASKDDEFTPNVSAIIYDEDELDAVTEWKLALDENRLHRPLPPVDEARAVVELRLRLDCLALRETLEDKQGWDEDEIPQSLEQWRTEYERLTAMAHASGHFLGTKTSVTWKQVEEYLGITEAQSRAMRQLANAPIATQGALLNTNLSRRRQLAITHAPAERQVELVEATQMVGYTPALVIEATASALKNENGTQHSAVAVLELTQRVHQARPQMNRAALTAQVLWLLNQPELAPESGLDTITIDTDLFMELSRGMMERLKDEIIYCRANGMEDLAQRGIDGMRDIIRMLEAA